MTQDSESTKQLTQLLARILERLAAPASVQRQYLATLGVSPNMDELALEFGDVWPAVRPFASEGVRAACEALDRRLLELSGRANEDVWDIGAIDGVEWAGIRALASDALRHISSP